MKRKMICSVLVLSLLIYLIPTSSAMQYANISFTDVTPGSWYAEPVKWAVAQGITTGTSQTTFSPDETCTNAQVLTFIWRACRSPEPSISNPFKDVSKSDYYYKAALWASESKMVEGDYFQPKKPCSRSLAVTYLWKEAGSPISLSSENFTDVSSNSAYAQAVIWAIEAGITNGTSDLTFSPEVACSRAQIITFLYRDLVEPQAENDGGSLEIKN